MNSPQNKKNRAILNSKSWRMTKPYRYLGRQGRRAAHVTKAMPSIIRRAGGLKALSYKAYETLRDEGISGLKRRWIRANTPGDQIQVSMDGQIVDRNNYFEWVRLYSSVDETTRKKIRNNIDRMQAKPKISIIMPVYNPNLDWLSEAVESVRSQLYDNWELCIADDCSPNPEVKKELEALQKRDRRISVVFRPENGHISAASNSAIELATGEWLALMDQDDLLPEDALYHVADAITEHPEARLIYSDEDKIDEMGRRFDPYFKSDWNPDLFLSHNMISHLGVYQRDLVHQLGGFRQGFEGSQDYDLAMRVIEKLNDDQILHIPRILYHWRSHAESTAQAGSNKNYALLAGEKTLNDHFQRTNTEAKAELLDFGMYRVHYALPKNPPLVSLIVPTRNALSLVKQCIDSILEKTTYPNYEVIIVDNNSDDPETLAYFETFKEHKRVRVLRDERPFNYSALNNNAVEHAKGEYIGLINNDIEVISPEWLSEMMSIALQPRVGAVGARLWYPNDTLQHGGVIVGLGGVAGHSQKGLDRQSRGYFGRAQLIQTLSAVTAACLIVSKNTYNEVGGLNDTHLTVAFNDVDFCLKVRAAGYRNIWTPYAELYHHESATRGLETTPEKKQRFLGEVRYMEQTWATNRWNDPAYSPNLAIDRDDFSLAWPPRLRAL
ncbi:glycosyltransferase family 2 protein [Ochrobactrum haematophilum]|uniref:Glycosyltransferase family 2 protein n=1 Tax=Brucella haematophila TaxID=419474 RepID=A0ABX1DJG3_9HYPH|nr:glycosyltransferase family 2 protein [Brucella haematophila]